MTIKGIQIGCEYHTYKKWKNFTDKEIDSMDNRALEWWKTYRKIVLKLYKSL